MVTKEISVYHCVMDDRLRRFVRKQISLEDPESFNEPAVRKVRETLAPLSRYVDNTNKDAKDRFESCVNKLHRCRGFCEGTYQAELPGSHSRVPGTVLEKELWREATRICQSYFTSGGYIR